MADIFPESREEEILVSMINGEEYNKAPESRIEALLLELKEVIEEGGGGGGTTNYNFLSNKPEINGIVLAGDKSSADLSIPTADDLAGKQDALPVTASGNDVAFNGDIQDGQGNTLSVLAEALTKTASGNPVVITDCAGGKARSLKTTINAIQDLHGYDHPWVGGAGKNMLTMTADNIKAFNGGGSSWTNNKKTISGVEFTILTDDAGNVIGLNANGQASETFTFKCGIFEFTENKSIIYNGITGGSASTYSINVQYGSTYLGDVYTGDSPSKSVTSGTTYVYLFVARNGTNFSNLKFYPMVRLASVSDNSFEPYENICPISGRDSVVITRSDGDEASTDFTIQLGQTVYGADINWDTGVVTVTDAMMALNSKSWGGNNGNFYTSNPVADIKCNDGSYDHCISDRFKPENQPTLARLSDGGMSVDNSGYIQIKCSAYSTSSDFVTAMGDAQLCYELAEPIELTLTPTEVQMLKGYNKVTIDSGSIELGYIAKAISGNDEEIAPLVGDKATKSYTVNDFIERADGLYRVTAPIASGASFTANNTVKMSIGEALTYLYNK